MTPALVFGGLFTPQGRAEPYPIYHALHDHGPVLPLGDTVFAVVGYDAATAALRDPALLVEDESYWDGRWRQHASARLLWSAMLFGNGTQHTRVRDPLRTLFTAKRVAELEPVVAQACDRLLADFGGSVDFMAGFAERLPVEVACGLLGVPAATAELAAHATTLASVLEPGWLAMDLTAADHAATWLTAYFGDLVEARRSEPRDDVLTRLVGAGLTHPEVVANLVLLLIAGLETTTSLLGNAAAALAAHPDEARLLRESPCRAPGFVAEVLRCESSVQLTARRAATATELADTSIPAGATVAVLLGAANRDPAKFPDPDRFTADRPGGRSLSFGSGAHHCLGAALARLQGQVAVRALVRRFREFEVTGEPARHNRFNLRGYTKLPMVLR